MNESIGRDDWRAMSDKSMEKPIKIGGMEDLPAVSKQDFVFWQSGPDGQPQKFSFEFYPLTAEEVEHIRASFPEPEPPTKPLEGKSTKDLALLAHQGLATTYKDYNDPDYQAILQQREEAISLEMVRVALRWGPMPKGQKPDETLVKAREEFAQVMRTRLTAGNYTGLIRAVTQASFALDQGLVDGFLTGSPR